MMSTVMVQVVIVSWACFVVQVCLAGACSDHEESCKLPRNHEKHLKLSPVITKGKTAILNGKCYSLCINKLKIATRDFQHGRVNCSRVANIESCHEGCLLRNQHPRKMKGDHCSSHCTSSCGGKNLQEDTKWRRLFGSETCPRQCNEDLCKIGCSMHLRTHKDIRITVPAPQVNPSPTRRGFYHVKETKLVRRNNRDRRVAMVIKITEKDTNDTYYDWQPGLKALLDLRFFSCREVNVSIKLIYGRRATVFSPSMSVCVQGAETGASHEDYHTAQIAADPEIRNHTNSKIISKLESISKKSEQLLKLLESIGNTNLEEGEEGRAVKRLKNLIKELHERIKGN